MRKGIKVQDSKGNVYNSKAEAIRETGFTYYLISKSINREVEVKKVINGSEVHETFVVYVEVKVEVKAAPKASDIFNAPHVEVKAKKASDIFNVSVKRCILKLAKKEIPEGIKASDLFGKQKRSRVELMDRLASNNMISNDIAKEAKEDDNIAQFIEDHFTVETDRDKIEQYLIEVESGETQITNKNITDLLQQGIIDLDDDEVCYKVCLTLGL